MRVAPNEVLAGKYRVVRMLGEGGMGVVAEALHLGLGHRVALKLLRSELVRPEHRERFFREARAAGSLHSEHVVAIKDVDTLPDGTPFLVMEYLEGCDLGRVVQQRGPIAVSEAADYVLQACHAIGEAHARGIVHRDLKPANLFLTHRPDGTALVKVLDFGIAKIAGADTARDLTATSQYMGSPSYMSPEQVRSAKRVDARTDVWALGVILYELLVGLPPFPGETTGDVLVKISTEPPLPFTPRQPAPGLEAIVLRCLQKDPDQRYPHVGELAAALAPFAGATGRARAEAVARIVGRTIPPVAPPVPSSVASPATPSAAAPLTVTTLGLSTGQLHATPARRRGPLLAALAVAIVTAAGITVYVARGPTHDSVPAVLSPASPGMSPVRPAAAPQVRSPGAPPAGDPGASPVTDHDAPGEAPPPAHAAAPPGGTAPHAPTRAETPPGEPRPRKPPDGRHAGAKPAADDTDFTQDRK